MLKAKSLTLPRAIRAGLLKANSLLPSAFRVQPSAFFKITTIPTRLPQHER